MDNKLYYKDAYIKSFQAKVVKQEQDDTGKWYAVLNQTAFYPTGGGQPHDQGTISNINVVNVEDVQGEIRHYLDSPLKDTSSEISGAIDWPRRYDHMQQHAGQHILSAAFDHLFAYKTVGFHLGAELLTIDLAADNLSEEEAKKAEELANQIILENRSIETKWVTEEELSQYSLRKETKVKEDIRLVIIPDFDYNGCGGTHPKATGEVRAVKILDWEKQKKNIRVQFVCGERVLVQFQAKQKVLLELRKQLNSPEKAMQQAISRLLDSGKALEKELEKCREQLLEFEAGDLLRQNEGQFVSHIFQNRSLKELQKLARLMTTENDSVVVFLAAQNDQQLQVVCARGQGRSESMKKVLGKAMSLIEGKGGGNDLFAQGGGAAKIQPEQLLECLIKELDVKSIV